MKAWLDGRGKSMARVLSPLVRVLGARGALACLGDYAAFLEGRGAGSGWDDEGEAKAVSRQIKRQNAVIFDVANCFLRSGAKVRRCDNTRMVSEFRVDTQRLSFENIKSSTCNLGIFNGPQQCGFIYNTASRDMQ